MPSRHRRRHRWRHAGGRLARGEEPGELACADGRPRIAGVGGVGGPLLALGGGSGGRRRCCLTNHSKGGNSS